MLYRSHLLTTFITLSLIVWGIPSSWALNSCELERPSEVVSYNPGTSAPSTHLSSDPSILARPTSTRESLHLGIGGSITVKFTVPIVNYPAAGALTVERPLNALPCSSYPVRAQISGSLDGEHFIPLGSTCATASFDLGALPWIAYLRIQDVTDTSDPAFGTTPISGFDLHSISGPGCLKYAHCAIAPSPDPAVTEATNTFALSLSSIGSDFVFRQPGSFEEYGNGSARLTGSVHRLSDPSTAYDLILSLTGKVQAPPAQSPILELRSSAYSSRGGTIDPSTWYYYKQIDGWLVGTGTRSGERIPVGGMLRSMQFGSGANGRETSLGGRGTFSYGSGPSENTAEITIGLTSCSITPPAPPPSVTPRVESSAPLCETTDLTKQLANLDSSLRGRVTTVNRATRLLLRHNRSQSNIRFKTAIQAKVHNLYALAWSAVWRHDRFVQTCAPSDLCVEIHLESTQAALAASARTLDAAVDRSLLYIHKNVRSARARKDVKELMGSHRTQRASFIKELAKLPGHSARCYEQGS